VNDDDMLAHLRAVSVSFAVASDVVVAVVFFVVVFVA
jgi:hypothetical protein